MQIQQAIDSNWLGSYSSQGDGYGYPRGVQASVTLQFSGRLWQTTRAVMVEKRPTVPNFF